MSNGLFHWRFVGYDDVKQGFKTNAVTISVKANSEEAAKQRARQIVSRKNFDLIDVIEL